jgi:uridine kinase
MSRAVPGHTPASVLIEAVNAWQVELGAPLVVAVDGHGAAGKTTLATLAADATAAALLHTDDFFRAAAAGRDTRPMARYYDWARLRSAALEPILAAGTPLIIVEGVSAAAPALADVVTRTVLVDTPEPERLRRLRRQIAPEEWDEEWLAAERLYFTSRPMSAFDLVISGSKAV